MMSTLTIDVCPLRSVLAEAAETMEDLVPTEPRISFDTPELLWSVLTPSRWTILRAMTNAGPIALREIARRVDRDVKSVHGDVHALLNAGIVERNAKGFLFPYDAVHVDFLLKAG
ncbi:transcriptional regulator [Acidithiobacillus sp. YTS05]|nr:transcriptional regulator [Acidithiobacillus sp. YTS05]